MNTYAIYYASDYTSGSTGFVEAVDEQDAICQMYEAGYLVIDGSDNGEYTIELEAA